MKHFGNLYSEQCKNFNKAEEYLLESYYHSKVLYTNNPKENTHNLTSSLNDLGTLYERMGKPQQGLSYLKTCYQIRNEEYKNNPDANIWSLATTLFNLGTIYREINKADSAIICYSKSLELFEDLLTSRNTSRIKDTIRDLHIWLAQLSEYDQTINYNLHLSKAIDIDLEKLHQDIESGWNDFSDAIDQAFLIYENRQDKHHIQEIIAILDSLHQEFERRIEEGDSRYIIPNIYCQESSAVELSHIGKNELAAKIYAPVVSSYDSLAQIMPNKYMSGLVNSEALTECDMHSEALWTNRMMVEKILSLYNDDSVHRAAYINSYATHLHNAAGYFYQNNIYEDAKKCALMSQELYTEILYDSTYLDTITLGNLANLDEMLLLIYTEEKQWVETIPIIRKSMSVFNLYNDSNCIKHQAVLYNSLAYSYAYLKQYDKAIESINTAIALTPEDANPYDSKGEILQMMGDREGAMKMWEKVVELEPNFANEYDSELYKQLFGDE